MKTALYSLLTGTSVGVIFTLLKLPLPVPKVFAGIVGIIGVYIGMLIVNFFR